MMIQFTNKELSHIVGGGCYSLFPEIKKGRTIRVSPEIPKPTPVEPRSEIM